MEFSSCSLNISPPLPLMTYMTTTYQNNNKWRSQHASAPEIPMFATSSSRRDPWISLLCALECDVNSHSEGRQGKTTKNKLWQKAVQHSIRFFHFGKISADKETRRNSCIWNWTQSVMHRKLSRKKMIFATTFQGHHKCEMNLVLSASTANPLLSKLC